MACTGMHTRGHSPTPVSEVLAVIWRSFESCTTQLLHLKIYAENKLSLQEDLHAI